MNVEAKTVFHQGKNRETKHKEMETINEGEQYEIELKMPSVFSKLIIIGKSMQ